VGKKKTIKYLIFMAIVSVIFVVIYFTSGNNQKGLEFVDSKTPSSNNINSINNKGDIKEKKDKAQSAHLRTSDHVQKKVDKSNSLFASSIEEFDEKYRESFDEICMHDFIKDNTPRCRFFVQVLYDSGLAYNDTYYLKNYCQIEPESNYCNYGSLLEIFNNAKDGTPIDQNVLNQVYTKFYDSCISSDFREQNCFLIAEIGDEYDQKLYEDTCARGDVNNLTRARFCKRIISEADSDYYIKEEEMIKIASKLGLAGEEALAIFYAENGQYSKGYNLLKDACERYSVSEQFCPLEEILPNR